MISEFANRVLTRKKCFEELRAFPAISFVDKATYLGALRRPAEQMLIHALTPDHIGNGSGLVDS